MEGRLFHSRNAAGYWLTMILKWIIYENEETIYIHDIPLKARLIFQFVLKLLVMGFERLKCIYIVDMFQIFYMTFHYMCTQVLNVLLK